MRFCLPFDPIEGGEVDFGDWLYDKGLPLIACRFLSNALVLPLSGSSIILAKLIEIYSGWCTSCHLNKMSVLRGLGALVRAQANCTKGAAFLIVVASGIRNPQKI